MLPIDTLTEEAKGERFKSLLYVYCGLFDINAQPRLTCTILGFRLSDAVASYLQWVSRH